MAAMRLAWLVVVAAVVVVTAAKKKPTTKPPPRTCDELDTQREVDQCKGRQLLELTERNMERKFYKLLNNKISNIPYLVTFTESNVGGRKGYTALLYAAETNNCKFVKKLVAAGALTDHRSEKNMTALYLLAEHGSVECVKLLLQHKADPNVLTDKGLTAVLIAAWNNHGQVVRDLLAHGADFTVHTPHNYYTALYFAAKYGDEQTVQVLIDLGADIDRMTAWNVTALLVSCIRGQASVVRALLTNRRQPADPNIKNIFGYTPLHKAVYYRHPAVVDLLLADPRTDFDAQDKPGLTGLAQAARKGYIVIVRKLLSKKADPRVPDKKGETPLHKAVYFKAAAVVDALLADTRTDINARDRAGITPLIQAARRGSGDMVRRLLEHGADVDVHDKTKRTALHWAARKRKMEAVTALLNSSPCPSLDLTDRNGRTPLQEAQRTKDSSIVSLLDGTTPTSCVRP